MEDFDLVTLLLGLTGVILAVVSLAWQAFTWHSEGARIKVDAPYVASILGGGSNVPVVGFKVRNVGRTAIEISGVYGRIGKRRFLWNAPPEQVSFPMTLDGLHSRSWAIDRAALLQQKQGDGDRMRIGVGLGTGKMVWSPRRKRLPLASLEGDD